MKLRLRVNGTARSVEAHPMERLLDVLRERLGLTGTKEGCGEGECGACTVLVDGEPLNSCLVPVAQVASRSRGAVPAVTTIEGIPEDHPLARAFAGHGAAQCGICTPGFLLAALGLEKGATERERRERLAGNLCRCTGYGAILRAVATAGKKVAKRGKAKRSGSARR